jgi:hypothetical protein
MLKKISVLILLWIIVSKPGQLAAQTTVCGGSGASAFILPSTSDVNLLVIYAYFPSGGYSGTSVFPSFAVAAAQHQENYYNEMSYNTHHVHVEIFDPDNGNAFKADNALSSYYGGSTSSGIRALNTEILDKAWAADNTVFSNVDAVFVFYGGDVFNGGTAVATLSHYSSHYSGCGAIGNGAMPALTKKRRTNGT